MKSNLVVLGFENAGLFAPKRFGAKGSADSGDKIFYNTYDRRIRPHRERRSEEQWDDIPTGRIGLSQVRNLLMVMCGYRPVSKFRPCGYKSFSQVVDKMARRSKVYVYNAIDSRGEYISETQMVRKAVDDAWNTTPITLNMAWGPHKVEGVYLSWERVHQLVGYDVFTDFIVMANSVLGKDVLKQSAISAFEELSFANDCRKDEFLQRDYFFDRKRGLSPFKYLISPYKTNGKKAVTVEGIGYAGYQGKKSLMAGMVRYGVSRTARLSGRILVDVDDGELALFEQGSGTATLLDGGFVRIDKVVDGHEESFDKYYFGTEEAYDADVQDQ